MKDEVGRGLCVEGLANVRDLGGRERRDGSLTPEGVFFRAENLDRVTGRGWTSLREAGVRTVLDLRRPDEVTDAVPDDLTVLRVDLDGDERDFWEELERDGRWGTPLYYAAHLRELPHRLAGVLEAIAAAPEGGILFHCGAGWDRTGLVAAVLLRAVEVTSDAALADYLASFANAEEMSALHERSFDVERRLEVLDAHGHTADSAFRAAYARLDVENWVRHAGLDDATVRAVTTWRGHVLPDAVSRAPGS
ncbi:tyrosine-protein phosphatase [Microbacterium aurantiacum]|uniref:tyrosine-protein phosphatase n=1 Tax=Microbacterium aurantiacum TaxID=162393 RepID=UPI003D7554B6